MKVKIKVKRFSPVKFALHEILRPGYRPSIDSVIIWTMIECKVDRKKAENAVFNALHKIEVYGLTCRDRDFLNLPNIKNRYPTYQEHCKY